MNPALPVSAGSASAADRGRPPRRLDPRLLAGAGIVLGVMVVALAAPRLAPYDPHAYPAPPLASPTLQHLLGSNDAGQDLFSQLLYGARVSIVVGLLVGVFSTALAWSIGLLSGLSRHADLAAGGVVDLVLILPPLPLLILLAAHLGPGEAVVVVTLSALSWGPFARVIRGVVQTELRKPYVDAARALGASGPRIVLRHVAPATTSVALVKFVTGVQYAVVAQATLAFLGLGDPSVVSWGEMVRRAAQSPLIFLSGDWLWWLMPPALAIGTLVAGLALLGWSLDDRMLRGRAASRPTPAPDEASSRA